MCAKLFRPPLVLTLSLWVWVAGSAMAFAEAPRDGIETVRADLRADRNSVIAEQMNFTPEESAAFWPIYRQYRGEVEKATDRLVELFLEYVDLYPNVPDAKAGELLKEFNKTEANLVRLKSKYLKKFAKVLPAAKVFRLAQLDNRLDLGARIGLASSIPLLPTGQASLSDKMQ